MVHDDGNRSGPENEPRVRKPVNPVVTFGKYVLAAVPIVWIFHIIDLDKLGSSLRSTEVWTVPVMAVLIVLLMVLQGVKWWMLLRAFLPHLSIAEVLSCHFKGIYYSIFLPTSAAQDVVRTVLLARSSDYGIVWGATWLARISGLMVMLALSVYGMFTIDAASGPPGTGVLLALSGAVIGGMGIISFSKRFTRGLRMTGAKLLPRKVMATIEHVREGIYRYRDKRSCLVQVLLVTVIAQSLMVLNAVFLIRGITGRFYFAECFTYIPLIEIVCLSVPLTPNGIGVRDALSALMFHKIGLPSEQLGTYVILGFASIVLKVVGGVPVLFESIAALRKKSD